MSAKTATRSYERWLHRCGPIVNADLRDKHAQMREDLFLFFRGTFYRWAQLWHAPANRLREAPRVLAVGDLHIGSFGTWRDREARLGWGINDFDEGYPLAYTADLVRLATSVKLAIDEKELSVSLKDGCEAIVDGYRAGLRAGGCPLVLAEGHENIRQFGFDALKPPKRFWRRLTRLPTVRRLPRDLTRVFRDARPERELRFRVVRRRAGLGSLGQARYVALAEWEGGLIAREAKALVPSAIVWLLGRWERGQPHYRSLLAHSIRARDPFQRISGRWLIRRLSPEASPIELTDLPKERNEEQLLRAMGTEAANVHLGTARARAAVLHDLGRRRPDWLHEVAKAFAKAVERDWREYRG
jgi:hypothetical protein